jgi:hypothetical protein
MGQQPDLNLRASGVGVMQLVLLDQLFLIFRREYHFCVPPYLRTDSASLL